MYLILSTKIDLIDRTYLNRIIFFKIYKILIKIKHIIRKSS